MRNYILLHLKMVRVLLTRPKEDAEKDREIFHRYGFDVILLPLLEFEALPFSPPRWEKYHYIYFGSKRGVNFFLQRVKGIPPHLKVLAVGKKTAQELKRWGIKPFLVLKGSVTHLVELAKEGKLERGNILVPTAEVYTKDIHLLEELGFGVDILPVYRTLYVKYPPKEVEEKLKLSDAVVFTSPSTFKALLENLQNRMEPLREKIIVAIGKTTARAIEQAGLKVDFIPSQPDTEVLAGELAEALRWKKREGKALP